MTRDDVIRTAREAGLHLYVNDLTEEPYALIVERFAALVAAAERKQIISANAPEIERINEYIKTLEEAVADERSACAQVCDEIANKPSNMVLGVALDCAAAIRARGEK
jgi:hypothetical protein